MKKIINLAYVTFLVIIVIFSTGCSKDPRGSFNDPIKIIKADLQKESTKKQVVKWDDQYVKPSIKAYDNVLAERNNLQKAGEKNQDVIAKKLQQQVRDSVQKIKDLREQLAEVQAYKLTDEYLYYARQMLERMQKRLECLDKQANATNAKDAAKFRKEGSFTEGRLVWEARYGYNNARSILLDGKATYNLNAVGRIKKGQSYETVMHILKMPGTMLPTIKVPQGKKVDQHVQVVWHDQESLVYVDFVNGKATTWKLVRTHNGFLNKR